MQWEHPAPSAPPPNSCSRYQAALTLLLPRPYFSQQCSTYGRWRDGSPKTADVLKPTVGAACAVSARAERRTDDLNLVVSRCASSRCPAHSAPEANATWRSAPPSAYRHRHGVSYILIYELPRRWQQDAWTVRCHSVARGPFSLSSHYQTIYRFCSCIAMLSLRGFIS